MSSKKQFIEQEEAKNKVFDFIPKKFPIVVTEVASGFVSSQEQKKSDFKISELVAEQSGIAEIHRKAVESQVEAEALEKLKEIQEKAYNEAYELGVIEGTEKAYQDNKEELRHKIECFDKLLADFEDLKMQLVKKNEKQILQLLQLMADKIAMDHIKLDKSLILKVISKVIESAQTDEGIVIKLSSDDYFFIESLRERQDKTVDFLKRVKIEAITDMSNGGCILETNYGAIDARIEERLEKVWKAIEDKMPRINEEHIEQSMSVNAQDSANLEINANEDHAEEEATAVKADAATTENTTKPTDTTNDFDDDEIDEVKESEE